MSEGGQPIQRGWTARRHRGQWRRVAMIALIFAGGVACGVAGMMLALKHTVHHAIQNPHTIAGHITDRLSDFLDLNDEQSRRVREILVRRHEALIDVRREIQPRLEVELTTLETEIASVLDDRQRAKWHEHAASVRAQWLPPIPVGDGE